MRFERMMPGLGFCLFLTGCVSVPNGQILRSSSKAEEARNAARVHTELGQHYLLLGRLQPALKRLKQALRFDPNYAPAYTVIAVIYEHIHDLPKAQASYIRAQQLEPDKGATNNNLGAFLCSMGKKKRALTYFRRAVKDPFYATPGLAWTNDGICRLQMNDRQGAEASFRHAIAVDPINSEALYQLARILYVKKDAFHASAFLQRYEAVAKKETPAALKLGYDIERRLGDKEAARHYSLRLKTRFPDSKQGQAVHHSTTTE